MLQFLQSPVLDLKFYLLPQHPSEGFAIAVSKLLYLSASWSIFSSHCFLKSPFFIEADSPMLLIHSAFIDHLLGAR